MNKTNNFDKHAKYNYKYNWQVSLLRCICDEREEGLLGVERQAREKHLAGGEILQCPGFKMMVMMMMTMMMMMVMMMIITIMTVLHWR